MNSSTEVRTFLEYVVPELAAVGIRLSSWDDLDDDDEKFLVDTFEKRIFPVLTPLAVDPGHPFPYISNLSLNLAMSLRDPVTGERRFARVKVPNVLPRFVVMGEARHSFERAIALDATYAPAYCALSEHYGLCGIYAAL